MADISASTVPSRLDPGTQRPGGPAYDLIELLFFAYRDFIGDADELLAGLGFGRAHHRVLHFVNRHPGMRVATMGMPASPASINTRGTPSRYSVGKAKTSAICSSEGTS